jgi:hypothetical protein
VRRCRLSDKDLTEAMQVAQHVQDMLVCSIASGTEMTVNYFFKKQATLRDLADLERNLDQWVRSTCKKIFKLKPRQIPRITLDIHNAVWRDDDDHTVTIKLDFGKIFPGERPQELLDAVKAIMARHEPTEALTEAETP